MGTNEVRINDPLYADKLRERLWQEYETELDRKEEERAEGERMRMRRLLKKGIITADELKEDPLFLKEYRRQKAKYGHANPRRAKSPTRRRAQTAPPAPDSRTRHQNAINTSIFPSVGYTSRPQTCIRRTDRPKTVQWERRPYIQYKNEAEDYEDMYDGKRRPLCIYKYEHPHIKELREEETVEGLYALAEEILDGKLPSQKAPAPKKVVST